MQGIELIESHISKVGFSVVGGCNAHKITHTVGFMEKGFPEVYCHGLSTKLLMPLLHQYYHELCSGVRKPTAHVIDEYFNLPIQQVFVIDEEIKLVAGLAYEYAAEKGLPEPRFIQWVWSDRSGKYPWDIGYDTTLPEQSVLGVPEHLKH